MRECRCGVSGAAVFSWPDAGVTPTAAKAEEAKGPAGGSVHGVITCLGQEPACKSAWAVHLKDWRTVLAHSSAMS